MTAESPTRTPEQIAASLIDQALRIKKQRKQQEIPVYSKIYEDSNLLAARFKTPGISDNVDLGNMVDDSLGINTEGKETSFSSGFNQPKTPKYDRWINPSPKHPGLFTIYETASIGIRVVATRLSIVVSEPDLTKPEHSSAFFYRNLQGAI